MTNVHGLGVEEGTAFDSDISLPVVVEFASDPGVAVGGSVGGGSVVGGTSVVGDGSVVAVGASVADGTGVWVGESVGGRGVFVRVTVGIGVSV